MGYQTLVIINNDKLHEVEKEFFGARLYGAILKVADNRPPADVCGGTATVIESHHRDFYRVAIIGGGTATMCGESGHFTNPSDQDMKIQALRDMARSLGFSVSKLRKKKGE